MTEGIRLKKNESVNLKKADPALRRAVVGLGWVPRAKDSDTVDLDVSAFLLNSRNKVRSVQDLIFYNNLSGANKSVEHSGDSDDGRTRRRSGDSEQIKVNLAKVPDEVIRIVFVVSIHDYEQQRQNFGQVSQAFIRIFNAENKQEVIRYDLREDYSNETAVIFGELYRNNTGWHFKAVGEGFDGGLGAACRRYGVLVKADE